MGRLIALILPIEIGSTNAQSTSIAVSLCASLLHLNYRLGVLFFLLFLFFLFFPMFFNIDWLKCNGFCDSLVFLALLLNDHDDAEN